MSGSETDRPETEETGDRAVVLDHLPHGRAGDDRPQYQKPPVAYALTVADLQLVELTLTEESDISIGDWIPLDQDAGVVQRIRQIEYDDLSQGARNELDYAVDELVESTEDRFIDFYNDAQPITLRLHQLNLLPGIGKKLRNNVLDARKRGPFDDFEELTERVSGLHRPKEKLVERILEELQKEDLKYKTFVGREDGFAADE
jgi:putative nucleotide binding protein